MLVDTLALIGRHARLPATARLPPGHEWSVFMEHAVATAATVGAAQSTAALPARRARSRMVGRRPLVRRVFSA